MDCRELRENLPELLAGGLDTKQELAAESHLRRCRECGREVAAHRRAWELLGVLDDQPALSETSLRSMATRTLAQARSTIGHGDTDASSTRAPAPLLSLRRSWRRAAAAALFLALAIGGWQSWRREEGGNALSDELPLFLADPDFVTNFEVIRDLHELEAQGDLLDLDDDLLVLDAVRGA